MRCSPDVWGADSLLLVCATGKGKLFQAWLCCWLVNSDWGVTETNGCRHAYDLVSLYYLHTGYHMPFHPGTLVTECFSPIVKSMGPVTVVCCRTSSEAVSVLQPFLHGLTSEAFRSTGQSASCGTSSTHGAPQTLERVRSLSAAL